MGLYFRPPRGVQVNRGHPLSRDLILCLLTNEGIGGKVFDISGNNHNGTFIAMDPHTDWISGVDGWGLDFDGADDEITFLNALINQLTGTTVTVSLWIRPTIMAAARTIFDGHSSDASPSANRQLSLFINTTSSGGVSIAGSVNASLTYSPAWVSDEWQHCTLTCDGTTIRIYRNGVQNASTTSGIGSGFDIGDNGAWSIGGNPSSGGTHYPGQVSNVMVWNRALSVREVSSLFQMPYAMFKKSIIQRMLAPFPFELNPTVETNWTMVY